MSTPAKSFQPRSFWVPRDASCLPDGEMGYDNPYRGEPKRGHTWYMDASGPGLFNNKKKAAEAVDGRPIFRPPNLAAPWDNTSVFQTVPGQFTDRLFGQEPGRLVNLVDRNAPFVGSGTNYFGKEFQSQYSNAPSVNLSMSHTNPDPSSCLSFGGIRKVKVNEVKDSENAVSAAIWNSYRRGDDNTISLFTNQSGENNISLIPPYNDNENGISLGTTFNKADGNFISVGHTYGKGDGPFISLGNSYDKVHENFISTGLENVGGDKNLISVAPKYDKHAVNTSLTYDKADLNLLPMGPRYDGSDRHLYGTNGSHNFNINGSHNFNMNGSNTICFGEREANPSGGIINSSCGFSINERNSCGLLTGNQNTSTEILEESGIRNSDHPVGSKVDAHVVDPVKTDNKPKVKGPKTRKTSSNNFPSNVKSLLSTGIFDGIRVKYSSWSREKNLDGIIKGTGYLCSCADCNRSKAKPLTAYEFERHAGAKTKHPNNHIYFESGKTVYAVAQELKTTTQGELFDAIENVTGSLVNQKNFRLWKASYQAASRELQRIYGKDEVVVPS